MHYAAVLVVTLFFASAALANPGDEIWRDTVNTVNGDSEAHSLASSGRRLFAAGRKENATGNFDMLVRAYSSKDGRLLWEQLIDEYDHVDTSVQVLAKRKQLYVAGNLGLQGFQDWHLRSYAPATGELLWSDTFDYAGRRDIIMNMALAGRFLVVVGFITLADETSDVLVRAYDTRTGAVAWEDQYDETGNSDRASFVAIKGRHAIVTGSVTSADGDTDAFLRTYNTKTGKVLWDERIVDPGLSDFGGSITPAGSRFVFSLHASSGDRLQARRLKDGKRIWDVEIGDTNDDSASLLDDPVIVDSVVKGGRIYWLGWTSLDSNPAERDWIVGATRVRNGELLWAQRFSTSGQDLGYAIAVQGRTIFASGHSDETSNGELRVRAYSALDGTFLWENVVSGHSDFRRFSPILVKGKRLYQASSIKNDNEDFTFFVRSLSTK